MNDVVIHQIQFVHSIQKKKNIFNRGNDCIKKFCSELKELGTEIVNYEQKEMTPLTDDENRYYEEQKNAAFVKKRFVIIRIKKEDLNYTKK